MKKRREIYFKIRDSFRINTYYATIKKLHSELERQKLYMMRPIKNLTFSFKQ